MLDRFGSLVSAYARSHAFPIALISIMLFLIDDGPITATNNM